MAGFPQRSLYPKQAVDIRRKDRITDNQKLKVKTLLKFMPHKITRCKMKITRPNDGWSKWNMETWFKMKIMRPNFGSSKWNMVELITLSQ